MLFFGSNGTADKCLMAHAYGFKIWSVSTSTTQHQKNEKAPSVYSQNLEGKKEKKRKRDKWVYYLRSTSLDCRHVGCGKVKTYKSVPY